MIVVGHQVAGVVEDQGKFVEVDVDAGKAFTQIVDKLALLIQQALELVGGAAGKLELAGGGDGELQVRRQFDLGFLQVLHKLFSQFGMFIQVVLRLLGIFFRGAGGGQLAFGVQREGQAGDVGQGGFFERLLEGIVEFLFDLLLIFADLAERHPAVFGKSHSLHGILHKFDHAGDLAGHGGIGGQAAQFVLRPIGGRGGILRALPLITAAVGINAETGNTHG